MNTDIFVRQIVALHYTSTVYPKNKGERDGLLFHLYLILQHFSSDRSALTVRSISQPCCIQMLMSFGNL